MPYIICEIPQNQYDKNHLILCCFSTKFPKFELQTYPKCLPPPRCRRQTSGLFTDVPPIPLSYLKLVHHAV